MNRLATFADGIVAIAATLLILSVDGAVHEPAELTHAWAAYVATQSAS